MLSVYKPILTSTTFFLKKIQEYLMYLLPITLISGSFLSDLSISVIAICFYLLFALNANGNM